MRSQRLVAGLAVAGALAGCATESDLPPGPRDGHYQGVGPAQGACPPAIMEFTVVQGQVRGRVQGDLDGGVSGSVEAADGTGFIKFHGQFSTLMVRNDGFEAVLTTKCGRLKVEGRRLPPEPKRG